MFALAFLLLCSSVHADLYRWVDPESGSVKFSNAPPPWYDTGSGPKVERVPDTSVAKPAAAESPTLLSLTQLRARWREMLLALSSQPTPDNARAFAQVSAELDRADPAGASRRKDEASAVLRAVPPR